MDFKKIRKFFKNLNRKDSRFFTLIEILISISIIAILSGLIITSQADSRALARDKKRIADLAAYQTALQEYYSVNKKYPIYDGTGPNPESCIADDSACLGKVLEDFLFPMPIDPLSQDPNFRYRYAKNDDAAAAALGAKGGSIYKLYVLLERDTKTMERDGGTCPGIQCPSGLTAVYEVYSTLGSQIAISYTGKGTAQYLSCDVMETKQCSNDGGVNVLGLAGKTASVSFTGGAHSELSVPWLEGWRYRKAIKIDNIAGNEALTYYQIPVTLNTQELISAGKMQGPPNCGADIRFTDSDGLNYIDYFIESGCNTASTKIWVKVPSIPAGSIKTIYLYYDNSAVNSESDASVCPGGIHDGYCTQFFDDFEDGVIDSSKWSCNTGAYYDYTESDGILDIYSHGLYHGTALCAHNNINLQNKYVEFEYTASTNSNRRCDQSVWTGITYNDNVLLGAVKTENRNYWFAEKTGVSGGVHKYNRFYSEGTFDGSGFSYIKAGIAITPSQVKCYKSGVLKHTQNYTFSDYDDIDLILSATTSKSSGGGWAHLKLKFISVRGYASPEPITTVNGEQEEGTLYSTYCICCFGPPGLGADCDAENAEPFLNLSNKTNAHVQEVWRYRKPVEITNTGGALSDYQVAVTVDTSLLISAGKMQADCDDIRFTDFDGLTYIDYYIEPGTCNTASTKIWVKVPSILASSTKTIHLYYGNSSTTSESNGEETFEFFDDFEDGDVSDWTIVLGQDGSFEAKKGSKYTGIYGLDIYQKEFGGGSAYHTYGTKNGRDISQHSKIYYNFKITNAGDQWGNPLTIYVYDSTEPSNEHYVIYYDTDGTKSGTWWGSGGETEVVSLNAWHLRDWNIYDKWNVKYGHNPTGPIRVRLSSYDDEGEVEVYVDDVIVRKYASPAPTTAVKDEETTMPLDAYACLSCSPARTITCEYRTLCYSHEATVCSISSYTNAHVGNKDKYDYKVCCKISL